MDASVVEELARAGVDVEMKRSFPVVATQVDDRRRVVPAGDEVLVVCGDAKARVRLKSITDLFVGSARPPSFSRGPTPEYVLFFALVERTAVDCCRAAGVVEPDSEFQRLYRLLAKRPDGADGNPLHSYIQAAVRLYMSLRDVSRQELEAVALRLAKSAKTFRTDPSSANYFDFVSRSFE